MKKSNWRLKKVNKHRVLPLMRTDVKLERFYTFFNKTRPYADNNAILCFDLSTGKCYWRGHVYG